MSGHSKWSTIKRKKGAADAKRGRIFTKLIKEITVAAREGGGDPEANPRLRTAVDNAKAQNMPSDNIDKAVKRGTGELEGVSYVRVTYEGYGPGGVALFIECLTDKENRTVASIRHLLTKHGGNLGKDGSVAWMFDSKGQILVDATRHDPEAVMLAAIDAGAEDVREDGGQLRVVCEPADLGAVREALEGAGVEIESADVTMEPKNTVLVKGTEAEWLLKLVDTLEEHDDVDSVHANFDVPEEILAKLAAA